MQSGLGVWPPQLASPSPSPTISIGGHIGGLIGGGSQRGLMVTEPDACASARLGPDGHSALRVPPVGASPRRLF